MRSGPAALPLPCTHTPALPNHPAAHLRVLQRLQLLLQAGHAALRLLRLARQLSGLLLARADAALQARNVLPHLEGLGVLRRGVGVGWQLA